MWGPLTKHDYPTWDKHPIEVLHTEFCKNILHVQRNTPNNASRAQLGQYPLILTIQKRALNFWRHIKSSDPRTLHYNALSDQDQNLQKKSPLSQLILNLTDVTHSTHPHHTIRPNHIITTLKEQYRTYWTQTTQHQHKLQCYSSLNREYTPAERKTLTTYRLSQHSLYTEMMSQKRVTSSHSPLSTSQPVTTRGTTSNTNHY